MKKKIVALLAFVSTMALVSVGAGCEVINGLLPESSSTGNSSTVPKEKTYDVTFRMNYVGGENETVEVEEGETVEKPADPVREGYRFDGWYTDGKYQELFDFDAPITKKTNIYAKWTQEAYKVTYVYNNGATEKIEYVEEATLAKPADPVYENYNFVNWYTDSALTKAYDFSTPLKGDLTLYAGWKLANATITFDYNYTGAPEAEKNVVKVGEALAEPTVPVRDLYKFTGWYVSKAADAAVYDFASIVEDSFTLYAKWTRTHYQVTFDANYAGAAEAIKTNVAVEDGIATDPGATRVGYELEGWYTDTECKTKADLTAIKDDTTFYANWKKQIYDVSFDLNYDGATGAPATQKVAFEETATEPAAPTRNGYEFWAWYTDADCSEENVFTFDMQITGNTTLYAKWAEQTSTPTGQVTVKLMWNLDGKGEYASFNIKSGGVPLTNMPTDPELEGYKFLGWYTDEECTTKFNTRVRLTENVTVYAKMMKEYVFEAELVNLEGKTGQGTSVNYTEEGLIAAAELVGGNHQNPNASYVSGGYYITGLYYTGAFIEFEINAAEEVTDAVLALRVSTESYAFTYQTMTSEAFQIIVNGTYNELGEPTSGVVEYSGFMLPLANLNDPGDVDYNKTGFVDCIVLENLHLNKGMNTIRLRVNNNENHGGTFHAEAPMIDCIYIYSDVELTMKEYPEYLNKVKESS